MWFIVSGFHFVLLLFPGSLNIELCPALSIPVTWSKHALGIRYGHVSLRHGRGELRVAEVITSWAGMQRCWAWMPSWASLPKRKFSPCLQPAAAGSHGNKPVTKSRSSPLLIFPTFPFSLTSSFPICQSVRLLCLWWGLNPEPLACKVYALPLNGSLHPQSSSKLLTLNSLPPCRVPLHSAGCSLGYARHFSFMRSYLSIVGSKIFTLPPSKDLK